MGQRPDLRLGGQARISHPPRTHHAPRDVLQKTPASYLLSHPPRTHHAPRDVLQKTPASYLLSHLPLALQRKVSPSYGPLPAPPPPPNFPSYFATPLPTLTSSWTSRNSLTPTPPTTYSPPPRPNSPNTLQLVAKPTPLPPPPQKTQKRIQTFYPLCSQQLAAPLAYFVPCRQAQYGIMTPAVEPFLSI